MDTAKINRMVETTLEDWGIPGAAIAVVRGDGTYVKGYGVREIGKPEPVTPDTLFAIGSLSKAFTATAIGILVGERKMAWDDPVRKHLPGFRLSDPLADANVTIRDLLAHRTGLGRNELLYFNVEAYEPDDFIRRIGLLSPDVPFRSAYRYNNMLYYVAGMAAGAANGGSWDDLVRTRILEPLGMSRTRLSRDIGDAADSASPHSWRDGAVPVPRFTDCNLSPAGSTNTSADELSRWLRFQLGDGTFQGRRVISKDNFEETHTAQMVMPVDDVAREHAGTSMASYCLGWMISDYRETTILSHGGEVRGFNATATLVPRAGAGLVVLTNLNRWPATTALTNALLDHLLGLPEKDWNSLLTSVEEEKEAEKRERKRVEGTRPSRDLADYAGSYENEAYGPATVSLDGEALTFAWGLHSLGLLHLHFDTFVAQLESFDELALTVRFALDADGEVVAARLTAPEAGVDREFIRIR